MIKESQTLKLKKEHEGADLPSEIVIVKIEGDAVFIQSTEAKDGVVETEESTEAILEMFYELKEELTVSTFPKAVVSAIDEIIRLFDAYGATQDPVTGITVKSKLLGLKGQAAKLGGEKPKGLSALSRKLS